MNDIDKLLYNFENLCEYVDNFETETAEASIGNLGYDTQPTGDGSFHSSVETAVMNILNEVGDDLRMIKAVREVLYNLDAEYYHFYCVNWANSSQREDVQEMLGISRRTYYRWKKEIIKKIEDKLKEEIND